MAARKAIESGSKQELIAGNANARFKAFKPEAERDSRKADLAEETTYKRLLKAWYSITIPEAIDGRKEGYMLVKKSLEGIRATQEDINEFLAFLKGGPALEADPLLTSKTGFFLSALVNEGPSLEYSLDLTGLDPLSGLGYMNSKRLVVTGDLHDNFGRLNSGFLELFGDADSAAFEQTDGETTIHGNCTSAGYYLFRGRVVVHGNSDRIGYEMMGGRIDILGHVEDSFKKIIGGFGQKKACKIGIGMTGGEIHVASYDKEDTVIEPKGGKIFIADKLVYDNGELVRKRKKSKGAG